MELPEDVTMLNYEVTTLNRDFNDLFEKKIGDVLVYALTCHHKIIAHIHFGPIFLSKV